MAFTPIEITGTFTNASGKAATGKVGATLSQPMQNAKKTIPTSEVKGAITNGKLVMKLYANDDSETLPIGTYYTFKVEVYTAPKYEFKTFVPHAAAGAKIDISELYEQSGSIGVTEFLRPFLSAGSNIQEIVNALGALGLVIVRPRSEGEHNMLER